MFSTTEDDDFFNGSTNPTGSNLASVFGASLTLKQNDASLVYTAPKTPRLYTEEAPKSKLALQSSVICTAFVEAFIIGSDRSQTPQGKCGLAVIGNQSVKSYDIIVYKSKHEIITRAKLKTDFIFTSQDENFASFHDDQKQQWAVHFETSKDKSNFVDHIQKCGAKISLSISLQKTNVVETKPINEDVTRKNSDAASDSSQSKSKANILSRMAKMGQPILPNNPQMKPDTAKPHISDSETDESEIVKKPTIKKRHKVTATNGEVIAKSSNHSNSVAEYVIVNGQLLPVSSLQSTVPVIQSPIHSQLMLSNHLATPTPQLTSISDPLNIFIAENRTHNCELRMNMSQLSSKLDTILSKIDKGGGISTPNKNSVTDLHVTIAERDKDIAEKQQLLEGLQVQYSALSKTSSNYQDEINECQHQIDLQKHEITQQNLKIQELTASLNEQTLIRDEQLQVINDLKATVETLEKEVSKVTLNNDNSEMQNLNDRINTLQHEIISRNAKIDIFATTLKQSMNSLYQEVMENFEEDASYSGNQIKAVLGQKLKKSTLSIIQEFNKNIKSNISDQEKMTDQDISQTPPSVPEF